LTRIDRPALARAVLARHRQGSAGIHGVAHWARVLENGRHLAEETGAHPGVVELFALFHDSCRWTDGHDNGHGRRGAEFARFLRGVLFDLGDAQFDLLWTACAFHTDGRTDGDVTVLTCWDADRLDLGRAGIVIRPDRLCTDAARDAKRIAWAKHRSYDNCLPPLVVDEWELDPGECRPGGIE
jgi:uncharacterized protein